MKTGIMENWVLTTVSSQPLMCRLVCHTCLEKMGDNDECLFVITKYLVIRLLNGVWDEEQFTEN